MLCKGSSEININCIFNITTNLHLLSILYYKHFHHHLFTHIFYIYFDNKHKIKLTEHTFVPKNLRNPFESCCQKLAPPVYGNLYCFFLFSTCRIHYFRQRQLFLHCAVRQPAQIEPFGTGKSNGVFLEMLEMRWHV